MNHAPLLVRVSCLPLTCIPLHLCALCTVESRLARSCAMASSVAVNRILRWPRRTIAFSVRRSQFSVRTPLFAVVCRTYFSFAVRFTVVCRTYFPFAVRTPRFALSRLHFAFRTSHFAFRTSQFAIRISHFTVRISQFARTSQFSLAVHGG